MTMSKANDGEAVERLLARRGLLHVKPAVGQLLGHRLAQRGLVFNEQDVSCGHDCQKFDAPGPPRQCMSGNGDRFSFT